MNLAIGIFYFLSFLTITSAAGILFTSNLLHAAFLLMVSLLCVSGIFIFAGADFLAIAQIMVYIGGILVLILFGIMMTQNERTSRQNSKRIPFFVLSVAFGLFYLLYIYIVEGQFASHEWIAKSITQSKYVIHSTIQPLGVLLMTEYLFPFELAGFILLLALIGSAFVAGKIKLK